MEDRDRTTDIHLRNVREALPALPPPDDAPRPPGPWDPVLREVFEAMAVQPDPWRPIPQPWLTWDSDLLTSEWREMLVHLIARRHPAIFDAIPPRGPRFELQPLPLRHTLIAAFTSRAIHRATLLSSLDEGGSHGSRAETYMRALTSFMCDPEARPPWPFPGPPPYTWVHPFDGVDLLVAAAVVATRAQQTSDAALRAVFDRAASSFVEVGTGRLR